MFNNSEIDCKKFGSYATFKLVTICYPVSDEIASNIELGIGFMDKAIADLQHTWPISLAIIFATFILSILLMFFIRACGGCLVISVIILYFGLIIAFGVVCLETAKGNIHIEGLDNLQDPELLETIAIVSFVVAGISFLVLLCSVRKIKIGIRVLKTTAEFTQEECQTILVPIFMFIAIVNYCLCRPFSLCSGSLFPFTSLVLGKSPNAMALHMHALIGTLE